MSGFRGIFLDSIHPSIVNRLDADTKAFSKNGFADTNSGQMEINTTVGAKYISERQVWLRAVPFAIPQTVHTRNDNVTPQFIPDVPQWRDWILYGAKVAGGHGTIDVDGESQQIPYTDADANVFGWGGDNGLYRKDSIGWDGRAQSGILNSPVPGIVSVEVSNKGDLGTIRRATLSIKVHNLADLEAIEMMYMVPGLSILLEWGWYHPKLNVEPIDIELIKDGAPLASTTLINTEILKKTYGVESDIPGDPTPLYNLEEVASQYDPAIETLGPGAGIYDGMLGVVTKFSWSNDGNGGYDVVVDVISPGSLATGIPAESYTMGGSLIVDDTKVPISDIRTAITSIKRHSRTKESVAAEGTAATASTEAVNTIEVVDNSADGQVVLSNGVKDLNIGIPKHKLATSEYGIKITLDNTTTPPSLKYEKAPAGGRTPADDYYIGEYKGGERITVERIRGDRTWWNQLIYKLTDITFSDADTAANAAAGLLDMSKELRDSSGEKIRDPYKLADRFSESRCEEIIDTYGSNEAAAMAWMEINWGDALRAGDFAVYDASGGGAYIRVKSGGTWVTQDTGNGDEPWVQFNNRKIWKTGHSLGEPKMEQTGEGSLEETPLGSRTLVDRVGDVTGFYGTKSQVTQTGKDNWGWTESEDGEVTDPSGQEVTGQAEWGDTDLDPVAVAGNGGVTVYKREGNDTDGYTYTEVASVQGHGDDTSKEKILARVQASAREHETSTAETRALDLEEKLNTDAEITTAAVNFGALSWSGGGSGIKPVYFGPGTDNMMIYAKHQPAYGPPLHELANGNTQSSEVGYQVATTTKDKVIFPIGMVAYTETYLSWRFIEDYLLSELYMPKAIQPGTDTTPDVVTLDTTFLSANRMSDKEKGILNDEGFLKVFAGLIERDGEVLTDKTKNRELYHSQHIINHKSLRSFNPQVCILPGQEFSVPIEVAEGVDEIEPSYPEYMLDNFHTNAPDSTDSTISGKTAQNTFRGMFANGKRGDFSKGVLRNIMINSNLIEEAAEKAPNVRKFCLSILNQVNVACGMPWKFKILTNSAIGKISIIDENYTPEASVSDYGQKFTYQDDETGVYKFTGIGTDNILQDVKIQSKLPTELQTMAYYSTLGTGNGFGADTQMFNMYRGGVVDRLRVLSNVAVINGEEGSEETRAKAESELIISYSDLLEQTRKAVIVDIASETIAAGESTAKQFVRKYIHGDTVITKGFRPPIPIDVSLTLHGISGIYMGNAIMIKTIDDGGILPNRYKKNVALQATSVDHSISTTGWATSIGTLMRQLPDIQQTTTVTGTRDAVVRSQSPPPGSAEFTIGNPYGAGRRYRVSSAFKRSNGNEHGGIDIASRVGTKLYTNINNATVIFRREIPSTSKGYGYFIIMKGKGIGPVGKNTDYEVHYGHLYAWMAPDGTEIKTWEELETYASFNGWKLQSDKRGYHVTGKVPYGTLIGKSGGDGKTPGTGSSKGAHLHMTIKRGGTKLNAQLLVEDYYVAQEGNWNSNKGRNQHVPNIT